MIKLRSIVFGLLLALASPLAAFAQCSGQAPASTYCGNPTGALALPGWKAISGLPFPSIAGGTVVGNRGTTSATATAITNPILGIPGTSTGQLGLAGATSGTVTILPQAAAGTYNFNLPTGAGTSGQPLLSGGGGASPMTFGTLGPPAGGTGFSSYVLGDTLYADTTTTLAKLAGNTTTAKQYLSQTGTGAISAAPAWATIDGGDITGAALTKVDDTNVTLTLGGTPTTALLRAASLTLGWTGQLGLTRGGTGLSAGISGGIPYFNSTSTMASSALLAANALVIGGGAGTAPSTTTTGSGVITAVGNAVNTNNGFATQQTKTPNITDGSGAGLSLTVVQEGFQIGNMVHQLVAVTYPATADGSTAQLNGLAVTVPNRASAAQCWMTRQNGGFAIQIQPIINTANILMFTVGGAAVTNANLTAKTISFQCIYPAT